uniref:Myeloid leukemia factor n=1 Tax=Rhabditophanes sp. KR3021 TaxID=114890 RepID=A0AC35UFK9_9BILA
MFGRDPFEDAMDHFMGNTFNMMNRHTSQMDRMFDSMMADPFASMRTRHPMLNGMIQNGNSRTQNNSRPHSMMNAMMGPSFGGMLHGMNQMHNTMGMLGSMMHDMRDNMSGLMNSPNAQIYSQSTMISYGPDGQPHYEDVTVKKRGDTQEITKKKKTGYDGEEELIRKQMIGDRAHITEKRRDREGKIKKQQTFVNLDEREADSFRREFCDRARHGLFDEEDSYGYKALDEAPSSGNRRASKAKRHPGEADSNPQPIVTIPDDDEEEVTDKNRASPE